MGKRRGGGGSGTLVKVGRVRVDKEEGVICKLEGHYESYGGINNTPHKQEESSLQGGSD